MIKPRRIRITSGKLTQIADRYSWEFKDSDPIAGEPTWDQARLSAVVLLGLFVGPLPVGRFYSWCMR